MAAPSCTSMMTRSAPAALRASAAVLVSFDDAADLDVGDAGGADQRGQVLGDRTDEADVDTVGRGRHPGAAVRGAGRGRDVGEGVGVVGALAHVGREVLPVGAALGVRRGVVGLHHPVDQVGVARVELVVAGRGHGQAGLVQHVEGRLVVLDEGLEGRGTDHVAAGSEDRVRVRRLAAASLHPTSRRRSRSARGCSSPSDGRRADRGSRWSRGSGRRPTSPPAPGWPSRRRRGGLRAARSAWSRERICDRIEILARVAFPWGDV